jgi:hypothetical protein
VPAPTVIVEIATKMIVLVRIANAINAIAVKFNSKGWHKLTFAFLF